ncbi:MULTISPECIES: anhydro-N-acetylmuramic acid kinase AnmK [unclassified Bacillus (in: firmicutes)]|uniref:anhydro-N-acetylmuramic acid kinase AnmK n=1 Tax=unclassified Bacillus (in: firmicutes) TaxID=185979 RepID=UPI0004E171AC|nr:MULTISPECIES: anhydro-N-acetylmuramic acid kinase AnmK [unclassified Bacillus (in: firmicutes)]
MYAVGLMSGTSLDGIDAALVEIKGSGLDVRVNLVDFQMFPFSKEILADIKDCISIEKSNVQLICNVNFKLGFLFAKAVKVLCERNDFPIEKVDFIGSHGQTIYHHPQKQGINIPSTLQIGEPAVIAYETNCIVVSNFRTMDMAAGGQGAPLVPYSEFQLYRNPSKNRVLQNIGGIGNATVLPKNAAITDIYAFDTGPGNMMIDEVCQQLFGVPYDEDGKLSSKGKVDEDLLMFLMKQPFITMPPPKTTGREMFGKEFTCKVIEDFSFLSKYDILTTFTMFTAKSIESNYRNFIFPKMNIDEVIISGGGSKNRSLISMIKQLFQAACKIHVQEDLGFSSEAKEAIAFALLANETIHENVSSIPNVTGANQAEILGNITIPYNKPLSYIFRKRKI